MLQTNQEDRERVAIRDLLPATYAGDESQRWIRRVDSAKRRGRQRRTNCPCGTRILRVLGEEQRAMSAAEMRE